MGGRPLSLAETGQLLRGFALDDGYAAKSVKSLVKLTICCVLKPLETDRLEGNPHPLQIIKLDVSSLLISNFPWINLAIRLTFNETFNVLNTFILYLR